MIYSELLVFTPYINLHYRCGVNLQPVFYHWRERRRIYAEILCTNKKAYSEGSAILYSRNTFQFPLIQQNLCTRGTGRTHAAHIGTPIIAPFITQIRSQASLIRHVRINFPYVSTGPQVLWPGFMEALAALRDNCPDLASLELAFFLKCHRNDWNIPLLTKGDMQLLDSHFRTMPSLRGITIDIYSDPYQEAEPDCGDVRFPSMPGVFRRYTWTVRLVRDYQCPTCALWFKGKQALQEHFDRDACTDVDERET